MLRTYGGPVLLIHGEDDRVIPVAHADANVAAAAESGTPATRVVYPATGHNNMPRGHGRWEDIETFLAAAGLLPSAADADAQGTPKRILNLCVRPVLPIPLLFSRESRP